jgi:pyruvate formate lyase activating enzyme
MQSGLVFNIQHYSLHDGPGIRTTVFLKGCPLACAWCHNPEGLRRGVEIMAVEQHCIVCGECRESCPVTVGGEGPLPGRVDGCVTCGACVEVCPTGARQAVGEEMTVEAVVAEVLKDRTFYEESGGGVTISGGEPLAQARFTVALLEAFRREGLHTVLDTTGMGRTEDLLAAARLSDLVLYDLKAFDADLHRRLTGLSNVPILENLRVLDGAGPAYWVRMPIVPGMNDGSEDLARSAALIGGLQNAKQLCLLPFHRAGMHKFERLGMRHELDGVETPSDERMREVAALFAGCGVPLRIGG